MFSRYLGVLAVLRGKETENKQQSPKAVGFKELTF